MQVQWSKQEANGMIEHHPVQLVKVQVCMHSNAPHTNITMFQPNEEEVDACMSQTILASNLCAAAFRARESVSLPVFSVHCDFVE